MRLSTLHAPGVVSPEPARVPGGLGDGEAHLLGEGGQQRHDGEAAHGAHPHTGRGQNVGNSKHRIVIFTVKSSRWSLCVTIFEGKSIRKH